MCRHLYNVPGTATPVGVTGIGIFSKFPMVFTSAYAYVGEIQRPVKGLQGVNESGQHTSLELIRQTESRVVVFCGIVKGDGYFRIGTTHGTWVKGGEADQHQLDSMSRLSRLIRQQGEIVIAGDFNFDKDGKVLEILKDNAVNCMPVDIDNTLDPELHPLKGRIKVAPDAIFSRGAPYDVVDIDIRFGVSDHGALSGTVVYDAGAE
jgi:hypothetical protein